MATPCSISQLRATFSSSVAQRVTAKTHKNSKFLWRVGMDPRVMTTVQTFPLLLLPLRLLALLSLMILAQTQASIHLLRRQKLPYSPCRQRFCLWFWATVIWKWRYRPRKSFSFLLLIVFYDVLSWIFLLPFILDGICIVLHILSEESNITVILFAWFNQ